VVESKTTEPVQVGITMKIAIDLDNTITASPAGVEFFRILTKALIGDNDIFIITNRDPEKMEETEEELAVLGIRFNKLVITENKSQYIQKSGIDVFFENADEYFLDLPEKVTVFKIREAGNFSFPEKRWVGSSKTTKMID
jgi:hypothetical protein